MKGKIVAYLSGFGLCFGLSFACSVMGQSGTGVGATRDFEIAGLRHPESVCQSGKWLFVSEIGVGMDPLAKDGDGAIVKIDLKTKKVVDAHFLPAVGKLSAPKGMALYNSILYVTDIDRVLGFDIRSRRQVMEVSIAETGFLNDPVVGRGVLYVSATDNGKIYSIDLRSYAYHPLPLPDSVRGANGLYYDGDSGTLYCVAIGSMEHPAGKIYAIDPVKFTIKELSDYKGLLDGVALAGHTLYFSDWKGFQGPGSLLALDLPGGKARELDPPLNQIAGPADFVISEDGKWFYIPSMTEGKVLIRSLRTP